MCSSVAVVERAGDRSTVPSPPSQPSSICWMTCTISKSQGGFPSRASLRVHSNDNKQDLGGLTASICRPSKAEKKPQKCKTPSLSQMWFLNTGAQQADSQISKAPESRRAVEVPLIMSKGLVYPHLCRNLQLNSSPSDNPGRGNE